MLRITLRFLFNELIYRGYSIFIQTSNILIHYYNPYTSISPPLLTREDEKRAEDIIRPIRLFAYLARIKI